MTIIKQIKRNYLDLEQGLINALFMTIGNHAPTLGSHREQVWKSFFENILPKKFTIAQSAFVVDSEGNVSKEVDLVIFDEQYVPYVLRNRDIKFIPIEAVMVVVQCKSKSFEKDGLKDWLNSFSGLSPSQKGFAGSANPSTPILNNTRRSVKPLKIICGLFETSSENICDFLKEAECHFVICAHNRKTGEANGYLGVYHKHSELWDIVDSILPDMLPKLDSGAGVESLEERDKEKWSPVINTKIENLKIYLDNSIPDKNKKEMGLLSLVFQLNQYLMLINNPMFFPHRAYIDMFNRPEYNIDEKEKNRG